MLRLFRATTVSSDKPQFASCGEGMTAAVSTRIMGSVSLAAAREAGQQLSAQDFEDKVDNADRSAFGKLRVRDDSSCQHKALWNMWDLCFIIEVFQRCF